MEPLISPENQEILDQLVLVKDQYNWNLSFGDRMIRGISKTNPSLRVCPVTAVFTHLTQTEALRFCPTIASAADDCLYERNLENHFVLQPQRREIRHQLLQLLNLEESN